MAEDIVRVLRILEYVGPRDWVEFCMKHREIKGSASFLGTGLDTNKSIREAIIGDYPEILNTGGNELGEGDYNCTCDPWNPGRNRCKVHDFLIKEEPAASEIKP